MVKNQLTWTQWLTSKFAVPECDYSKYLYISFIFRKANIFPDETTATTLFYGIPFNEIPIVNIKVSPNNTIISVTDTKGTPQIIRSCGMEGFKNTRKGTNIAAQATAISLSGVSIFIQ